MTEAQLMEEELQQSVMVSEDEQDMPGAAAIGENYSARVARTVSDDRVLDEIEGDEEASGDNSEDEDAVSAEDGQQDGHSEDESGDEDAGEEDDDFEVDAEGEDDDEVINNPTEVRGGRRRTGDTRTNDDNLDEDESEDGEDDDEGVGAVKIKPGETDDEDGSSASGSDGESEGDGDWEEAAENPAEEDESEDATSNLCMFCKQDEDNDPGEEFESYLTCVSCGENGESQSIISRTQTSS
jgi:histone acetyltransferase SAS3